MADVSNINLINKTLDVVELLASEPREMGVSEISRRLKMVKSGTYRILNSLKEREYVYQNPINKLYGLGLKFYFIGSSDISFLYPQQECEKRIHCGKNTVSGITAFEG